MIKISDLTANDVGKWVRYAPMFRATESGRIKSWNDEYIFVVYYCDNDWDNFQNYTGNATRPEDLNET
jgi:hypothetical protein